MDLSEMFRRAAEADDAEPARKTPPDVLAMTLREIAERYAAPCPFKPGDLVTPRRGYNSKGAGDPHIVVEVADPPLRNDASPSEVTDIGSAQFGSRLDVRLVTEAGGAIMPFWMESWALEPYTGPVAEVA